MASRILHLAVADKIKEQMYVADDNRFKLGMILPDAYNGQASKTDSHLKIWICNGTKKTYDLERFRREFHTLLYQEQDALYFGYYLHLIQDLIFRRLMYEDYHWNPVPDGNVLRLHNDYHLINRYAIDKYGLKQNIKLPENFRMEKIYSLYPFDVTHLLDDLQNDFMEYCDREIFFFTKSLADEFITKATDVCVKEMAALRDGNFYIDAYEWASQCL